MNKFVLDRIPLTYTDAPFWGNGTIGSLLYVKDNKLLFSMDHVWLWELRESLPDCPHADYNKIIENPYGYLHSGQEYVEDTDIFHRALGRTKLPGLTMSLELPAVVTNFLCETDFQIGISDMIVTMMNGEKLQIQVRLDSCENVLKVTVSGKGAGKIRSAARGWDTALTALSTIKNWDYPVYRSESDENQLCMVQVFSGNQAALLLTKEEREEEFFSMYTSLHVVPEMEEKQWQEHFKKQLECYQKQEEKYLQAHIQSYHDFWVVFDIKIPNERLQQAFYTEMYKIFCNERENSLPVTLQGIWNPDTRMPAWFGDLHNDLNVQACYWAAFKTGNYKLAYPYIAYYTQAVPRFEERAEKLFGVKNAIHIPTMMAPSGYGAASEWCFWNTLLGPELYVSIDFCWYYEYSRDIKVLEEKIYPFLKKVINLYLSVAAEDENGIYHIPLSHSPEVFDEEGMLMKEDATFVISSLHYLLEKIISYGSLLGQEGDLEEYKKFHKKLVLVVTTEKGYPIFPNIDVFESHRHLCQMFPIFPLSYDAHSQRANRSLDAVINLGFTEYAAFTFPYLAIMAARCGRGNMCRTMLEIYCMGFCSGNSFTVNGDPYQNGLFRVSDTNAGVSSDAFTLESGFMVPAALCEMMGHRAGNTIYLAAGIPDEWKEYSAHGITVEGGHKISFTAKNYKVREVTIIPGCDEEVQIECPHAEPEMEKISIQLKKDIPFHFAGKSFS